MDLDHFIDSKTALAEGKLKHPAKLKLAGFFATLLRLKSKPGLANFRLKKELKSFKKIVKIRVKIEGPSKREREILSKVFVKKPNKNNKKNIIKATKKKLSKKRVWFWAGCLAHFTA